MAPVRELLSRIRWDREFGRGHFQIGYHDNIEKRVILAPFEAIHFEKGNTFSFQLEDEAGEWRTIPFHRVREIYRDGALIWQRAR